MRAISVLVIHPELRFRTEAGRLTRAAAHPVFFAADAEGAREVLEGHPSIRVVAVAEEAGGRRLLESLTAGREGTSGFVLDVAESRGPARAGLDRRLADAVREQELLRERRLRELFTARWRRRASRAAARLAAERLERLLDVVPAHAGAGVEEVRP